MINGAQLVHARQKPLDQIPEWDLCCPTIREKYKSDQAEPLEALVILPYRTADFRCDYCGHVTLNVKIMTIARRLRGNWTKGMDGCVEVIFVDCFEFDEGLPE